MAASQVLDLRQPERPRRRWWWVVLAGLLVLVVIAGGVWLVRRQSNRLSEVERVKIEVGKLMILPRDEEPALATITDKDKLQNEFLRGGETGDRVLIYAQAKRVIIYRPKLRKIVDVGPVSIVPLNEGAKR